MKKRSIVALLLIAILMVGTIIPASAASGSWKVNDKVGSYMTSAEKKVFDKAVKGVTGVKYTPVMTVAKQVVSGVNYAFFCKATTVTKKPVTSWKVLIVNQNAKGKVKLLKVNKFDYKKIKTCKTPYGQDSMEGGWAYNTKSVKSNGVPSGAKKAFNKAVKGLAGLSLTPLALLGTQVVSGTNYKFLCRGATADKQGTVCLYEVNVYKDVKGNCSVMDCNIVNLPKYLTH